MPVVRNVLGVFLGAIVGAVVNMALVVGGSSLVPPPEGVNPMDAESIAESMHLFGPQHFAAPFIAHAAGTLVGALVAYLVAASYRRVVAYVVGAFFLAGGISAAFMIPAPTWFVVLDLVGAYIPMACLATLIGRRLRPGSATAGG